MRVHVIVSLFRNFPQRAMIVLGFGAVLRLPSPPRSWLPPSCGYLRGMGARTCFEWIGGKQTLCTCPARRQAEEETIHGVCGDLFESISSSHLAACPDLDPDSRTSWKEEEG